MRRLEELATPPAREMPVGRDPFKVPMTALTYKISKRLLKIAFPKVPTEIMPPRIPGKVSPAALKAVGTYFSNFFPSPLFLSFSPSPLLASNLPLNADEKFSTGFVARVYLKLELENGQVGKFSCSKVFHGI